MKLIKKRFKEIERGFFLIREGFKKRRIFFAHTPCSCREAVSFPVRGGRICHEEQHKIDPERRVKAIPFGFWTKFELSYSMIEEFFSSKGSGI